MRQTMFLQAICGQIVSSVLIMAKPWMKFNIADWRSFNPDFECGLFNVDLVED